METERMQELREKMNKQKKNWVAVVRNVGIEKEKGIEIRTNFYSNQHELKNILHKLELDIMTNLDLGIGSPIVVQIQSHK